jgi:hypothetical protein
MKSDIRAQWNVSSYIRPRSEDEKQSLCSRAINFCKDPIGSVLVQLHPSGMQDDLNMRNISEDCAKKMLKIRGQLWIRETPRGY